MAIGDEKAKAAEEAQRLLEEVHAKAAAQRVLNLDHDDRALLHHAFNSENHREFLREYEQSGKKISPELRAAVTSVERVGPEGSDALFESLTKAAQVTEGPFKTLRQNVLKLSEKDRAKFQEAMAAGVKPGDVLFEVASEESRNPELRNVLQSAAQLSEGHQKVLLANVSNDIAAEKLAAERLAAANAAALERAEAQAFGRSYKGIKADVETLSQNDREILGKLWSDKNTKTLAEGQPIELALKYGKAENPEQLNSILQRAAEGNLSNNARQKLAEHINSLTPDSVQVISEASQVEHVAAAPAATSAAPAAPVEPPKAAPDVEAKTTAPSDKDLKQAEKFFEDNKSMKLEEFTGQLAKAEKFNGFQKALGGHAGKIVLAGAAVAAASSLLPNQTSTNEDGTPGDEKWGAGKKALVFAGGTAAVAGAIAKPTWGKTLHIAEMEKVLKQAGKSATTIIGHAV